MPRGVIFYVDALRIPTCFVDIKPRILSLKNSASVGSSRSGRFMGDIFIYGSLCRLGLRYDGVVGSTVFG